MKTAQDFWDKVDQSAGPEGCWPWQGGCSDGYGLCRWGSKTRGAHVVAYDLTNPGRELPFVCHSCDNPPCCNPAHLFEGTAKQNIQDAIAKGRMGWQQPKPPKARHITMKLGKGRYKITSAGVVVPKLAYSKRCCLECGVGFTPERGHAVCCSTACRKAFNNRRMLRGAALYDLFMCLRYDRKLAKLKGVWTLVCALAFEYRREDERERAGRPSWVSPDEVVARNPWLGSKLGKV